MTRLSFHRDIRLFTFLDFVLFPSHRSPSFLSTSSIVVVHINNTSGNEQRQATSSKTKMINYNILYLYVVLILHFLWFDGGFGFQSFCRSNRWGATNTQDDPYHPTSPPITTTTPSSSSSSSSPFSTILCQSRNLQLQLKKASIHRKEASKEIKDWLQNRLNLTDKEIERIYNNTNVFRPHIIDGDVESTISSRIESLDNKIKFLQTRLNVTDKEISKIFTGRNILLHFSSEAIGEKLDWLQSRLDLDGKQLSTVVRKGSSILTHSIENNVSPKLTWWQERFDLNTTQLRTFVLKNPIMLNLQIDSMENKLSWYENWFNFPDSEKAVKKIMRRQPSILNFDVESVDEKLTWLQNRLDLSDFQLYKICQGCPTILASHVDNKLEPHLCFLASRFCLDQNGLRMMICKMPTLFSISIDNIDSTIEFYEDILGTDDAIKQIGNMPVYLCYSLEGRLKPRLANVTKLGLVVGQDVPLTNLATYTNKEWDAYYSLTLPFK